MSGNKDDKGEKARLRIGRYRTQADKEGQGARPFVYVPDGFDLERAGAIGEVLKAAGVSKMLGQDAPSMVFCVPKQGTHVEKLEEAAAVRKVTRVAQAPEVEKKAGEGAASREETEAAPAKTTQGLFSSSTFWRGGGPLEPPKEVALDPKVVLLTADEFKREQGKLPPPGDGQSDENASKVKFDESLFKNVDAVDSMYLEAHRAALRGRVKRLMGSVSQCCEQARAVVIFDNARRNNPQLDLFTDSGKAVLLGTYEAKDLVAWLSVEEKEPEGKIDESKDPWWAEAKLRAQQHDFLGNARTVEYASGAQKPPNAPVLPNRYDGRPKEDRVRDVPHKAVTHALFFSSDQKRRQFENLLAGAVPEGVLLVGGTPHSFRKARQALRAGKPIFVFDETGGAATLFATMFKAHQERAPKNNSSPWFGPNQQDAVCIAQNWHVYFADFEASRRVQVSNLPPDAEKEEVEKFFAAAGKVERVHPSTDPGGVCVVTFADHKVATKACKDLNNADFDGQTLTVTGSGPRAPWHNWMAWNVEDGIKRSKDPAGAIMDAIATEAAWPPLANDDAVCIIKPDLKTDVLTDQLTRIMLTVEDKSEVRGKKAEGDLIMDAWSQWSVFMDNASSHFWNACLLYVPIVLLTFFAVVLATWESYLKLIGKQKKNRQILRYTITVLPLLAALFIAMNNKWQPMIKWAKLKLAARSVEREIYKFRMRVGEYAPRRQSHSQAFRTVDALQGTDDDAPLLASQPIKSPRECFSENLAGIWDTVQESEVVRGALEAPKIKEDELVKKIKRVHTEQGGTALINREKDPKDVENGDDFKAGLVKPLMPQEYLERRVYPKLAKRLAKAPKWSGLLYVLQACIFLCTFAAGICGAFDAPLLVPAVLALSAAISAWIEFGLYPQWLRATNGTIAELKNIDIWWRGLTFIQHRQAYYKELLVARTEYALSLEIGYISQLAVKRDKKMGVVDDPEDEGGNEKKPQASASASAK